jgi:threonine/homoserine/homoserine lactone efflux protein
MAAFFTPGTEGETWITVGMIVAALLAPVLIGFAMRRRDRSGAETLPRPVGWVERAIAGVLALVVALLLLPR